MFRLIVFFIGLHCALCSLMPYKWVDVDESFVPYIVQGEDAEVGKYPYQVSLHMPVGAKKQHFCGASILTKNWVMTAAHCCAAGIKFSVLVGSNSLSSGGEVYKTGAYKIHPNYEPRNNWKNDICLIPVTTPIKLSNTVQQVLLPPQGTPVKDGELVTVTGWGYTTPNSKVTPDKLQVGKNFIAISNSKCGSLTNITMYDAYLCVNGNREGQGICQGDSGGPVVRAKDGAQLGIASWIFMPCGNKLPDFFARVPTYIDWIKQVLGADAKDLKIAKN